MLVAPTAAGLIGTAFTCARGNGLIKSGPAQLPASVAARYPDGLNVRVTLTLDASGKVVKVVSDADPALRATVAAWLDTATYVPTTADCKPLPGDYTIDATFFPPASGVVGFPSVVDGIDFTALHYTDGPGNCKQIPPANNSAGEVSGSVEGVFAGSIGEKRVALVVLSCDYNGHGFDDNAQLFEMTGAHPRRLGTIASGGRTGPDSDFPRSGWLHVSYVDGKLYADAWDSANRCNKTKDWISSIYTIKAGKLTLLNALHHHRAGGDACTPL